MTKEVNSDILARLFSFQDISYDIYQLPVCAVYLFGDDTMLRYAAFARDIESRKVAQRFPRGQPRQIVRAIKYLACYIARTPCALPDFDLSPFTDRERAVYSALVTIPFGATVTYGALAAMSGIPRGARFVGNTMAKNIFPIFIPCHRVILATGAMGNYTGGVDIKESLLRHEGAL